MSNNYTQFSTSIDNITEAEKTWARNWLDKANEAEEADDYDEDEDGKNFEIEIQKDSIWIYSEESGSADDVADFMQEFLAANRPNDCLSFEWASTCSRPVLDQFGGGGVFITAEDQQYFNPWSQILEAKEEFEKRKAN